MGSFVSTIYPLYIGEGSMEPFQMAPSPRHIATSKEGARVLISLFPAIHCPLHGRNDKSSG